MSARSEDQAAPLPMGPRGVVKADSADEAILRVRLNDDAYDRVQVTADGAYKTGNGVTPPAGSKPATLPIAQADVTNLVSDLAARARKPATADAVVYVSTSGLDSNDGLSWGSAKLTIQAAVSALPVAGGTVKIGAGTFTLGTQTAPAGTGYAVAGILSPSNVTFQGAGRKRTLLTHTAIPTGTPEGYFVAITNADTTNGNSHIVVRDIGFDMPAPLENATGMDRYDSAVFFAGASNCLVENCWIKNGSVGFNAKAPAQNTATVLSAGGSFGNIVRNCVIENMTQSIFLFQSTDCWVVENYIEKVWDDAILIGSAGAGHRIISNRINSAPVVTNKGANTAIVFATNDGGAGGDSTNQENMRDIVVSKNVLFGNTGFNSGSQAGVSITGGARDITIEGNHVYGNRLGISIVGGRRRNIKVLNNHVFRNTGDGIRVHADIVNIVVEAQVVGNSVWNNTGSAIDLYSNGTLNVDVAHNWCYDDQGTPTQTRSLNIGTEAGKTNTIRASNNRLLDTTAVNFYGVFPPTTTNGSSFERNVGYNPRGAAGITVAASPFTYIAADYVAEAVYISGGTVSAIAKNSVTLFASTDKTVWLEPGESVTVTYSAAPTMTKDRK